jgi:hypothetical protein
MHPWYESLLFRNQVSNPGDNPTTESYNARVVKIYNIQRFGEKNYFSYFKKHSSLDTTYSNACVVVVNHEVV